MKLLACHIDNFGKLCDVSLRFYDGLNVVNQSNAWGKSTLAAFLKAMFYGLDSKKTAGAFEKERVLYRPWQGGAFGGEVDFEINGKQYRISRTFGRTEKTDQFHLYDLKTKLESFDYSEEIGHEIFELDSASFRRSIYIAQNDCASGTSDGINAKLGNLAANTDDINNFESANQQLKDILNQLTPDRVTGSIKKRKSYITQIKQELLSYEAAQLGMDGVANKEQQVSQQIYHLLSVRKEYAEALVEASEESRRKALYAQYEEMCQDVEEKEKKKDAYKTVFPVGVPTEAEFQQQMQNLTEMNGVQATARGHELSAEELDEYSKLQEMFEQKVPSDKEIDATLELFNKIDKEKEEITRQESKLSVYQADLKQEQVEPKFSGSVAYGLFLFFGIGIAFVGVAAIIIWYFHLLPMVDSNALLIIAMITGVCGAIFGTVGAVLGIRVSREKQTWAAMIDAERANIEGKIKGVNNIINARKDEIRKIHSNIGNFLGEYHVYCEVGEYQSKLYEMKNQTQEYLRMKEKKELTDKEKTVYTELRSNLEDFTQKYQFKLGEDETYAINYLQTKATEYQMAQMAYKDAYQKKETFEKQQSKSFWSKKGTCPYSIEELNSWIEETDQKLEELKAAKNQYTKQLQELQEQLDLRDEKETELVELKVAQEKDIQKYDILKMTQSFLQQAKEQFTARYLEPISEGFGKYYSMLMGEERENWVIDANINLRIKEMGELRDVQWLSAGYQDLIGVCMRLALVDAMYQEEKPFLILDDPFVNLDQDKVTAGNELLMEASKEYQVIYFTCHDSRSPLAK